MEAIRLMTGSSKAKANKLLFFTTETCDAARLAPRRNNKCFPAREREKRNRLRKVTSFCSSSESMAREVNSSLKYIYCRPIDAKLHTFSRAINSRNRVNLGRVPMSCECLRIISMTIARKLSTATADKQQKVP